MSLGGSSPIEHLVVLMLENRSFDHIFGFRLGGVVCERVFEFLEVVGLIAYRGELPHFVAVSEENNLQQPGGRLANRARTTPSELLRMESVTHVFNKLAVLSRR